MIDDALAELDGSARLVLARAAGRRARPRLSHERHAPPSCRPGPSAPHAPRARAPAGAPSLRVVALAAAGFGALQLADSGARRDRRRRRDAHRAPFTGRDRSSSTMARCRLRDALRSDRARARESRPQPRDRGTRSAARRPHHEIVVDDRATARARPDSPRRPRRAQPGQFTFWHTFPAPGHYMLRVFPPSRRPACSAIDVDVR